MNVQLLAIDLDGTLVDSAPDIAHCLDRALEAVGLEAPGEESARTWIGDGIETLIRRALASARAGEPEPSMFARALETFLSCYERNLYVRSRLYPGVRETLDVLAERGVRCCCITNKRAAFAEGVLEQAGIRNHFDLVLGGDSLSEKKPSPLPLEAAAKQIDVPPRLAAMVGDSHHDYHAARAAGFRFIWAAYGYCKVIDFDDEVARIDHFPDLVQRMQEG